MGYKGAKFKDVASEKRVPRDPRIKRLRHHCRTFHEHKLAPPYEGGSYGNLSFRVEKFRNPFIITCSHTNLGGELPNERFAKVSDVNLKDRIVHYSGENRPSSESMLHYAIYNQRKDINAIFHGHSQEILDRAEEIDAPCTKQEEEYGSKALVDRVLEILNGEKFLIMKNHGFLALGRTMGEAGNLALEMHNLG